MASGLEDPHVLERGHAPTPFTAEEIRGGCPAGRSMKVRVDAPGEGSFYRVTRFLECDEVGAVVQRQRLALDGSPIAPPEGDRVTWRDLQAHASVPADATTIDTESIQTAIGKLDCLRYTVSDEDGQNVFWFATALPGMPVQYLTRANGQVVALVSVAESVLPNEG